MSSPDAAGLPQERTSLAWRRTTLSLFVLAVVVVRAAILGGGSVALLGGAVVLVAIVWLGVSTVHGGCWARLRATSAGFSVLRDGRLPLVVTAVTIGLAIVTAI